MKSGKSVGHIAIFLLILTLAAGSYLARFPGLVQAPYWYLSYKTGFVRRGLMGTLVSPFILDLPLQIGMFRVAWLCAWIALVYVVLLAILAIKIYEAIGTVRDRLLWLAVVGIAIASPGLSMLGFDLGTLDTMIGLAALLHLMAVLRRSLFFVLLLAILGPLVHEGYFVLALPLIAAQGWLQPQSRPMAVIAAAMVVVTTLFIWHFSTTDFIWQPGIPIDPVDLAGFTRWQLGQKATLMPWPDISFAFLPWPVICVLAIAVLAGLLARAAGPWASARVLAGSGFASSLVLVGVDVERFVNWACITAPVLCGLETMAARFPCMRQSPTLPSTPLPPSP